MPYTAGINTRSRRRASPHATAPLQKASRKVGEMSSMPHKMTQAEATSRSSTAIGLRSERV